MGERPEWGLPIVRGQMTDWWRNLDIETVAIGDEERGGQHSKQKEWRAFILCWEGYAL